MSDIATFASSMIAGGFAGLGVDISLFPLDSLKTRMQSSKGFFAAGGFKGLYQGLGPAAVGSAPTSAVFFVTYEYSKQILAGEHPPSPFVLMTAAAVGEITCCLARVPVENIKQKMQAGLFPSAAATIKSINSTQGLNGFYRGYFPTIMRDVPFSFIQFPIWEYLKRGVADAQGSKCEAWQGALCGSAAGVIAAFCTTPADVIKTRLMLGYDAQGVPYRGAKDTLTRVYAEGGMARLFSGWQPRVCWIGIGATVYLGIYDKVSSIILSVKQ